MEGARISSPRATRSLSGTHASLHGLSGRLHTFTNTGRSSGNIKGYFMRRVPIKLLFAARLEVIGEARSRARPFALVTIVFVQRSLKPILVRNL